MAKKKINFVELFPVIWSIIATVFSKIKDFCDDIEDSESESA